MIKDNEKYYDFCGDIPAVFKYYVHWQLADKSWTETNLWMRLPRHANIVSFDRVVADELAGRGVGFTSDYIAGGPLEANTSRVFQLAWVRQLMRVVDELNLVYGIAHQGIAPRNLLVDEPANAIKLFDFHFAARIGHMPQSHGEWYDEAHNDIKGVIVTVYEILAHAWVQHPAVALDHPVAAYKAMLSAWQETRAALGSTGKAPKAIDWPPRPTPPLVAMTTFNTKGQPTSTLVEDWTPRRQDVRKRDGQALEWERPPQERLEGKRMLATGKPVKPTDL